METSADTLDFFKDALSLVPEVTFRPMMGGYCAYSAGRIFGLVCADTLFLKTTPKTVHLFSDKKTRAYPGSSNNCQVNAEWLEDREQLAEMVCFTLESLPHRKGKRKTLKKGKK
jgi:TfoX/Sxy family transcriptional regulator of competence genes